MPELHPWIMARHILNTLDGIRHILERYGQMRHFMALVAPLYELMDRYLPELNCLLGAARDQLEGQPIWS